MFKMSVNIVSRNLYNKTGKGENADKVRYHHKTVEGVGNIPSERGCHYRTEDNGDNVDYLEDNGCLCAKEVFPSL